MTTAAASVISLWGQAWELVVRTASGNEYTITRDTWEPEALRVVFDVTQNVVGSPWWSADISIYNLNEATAEDVLLNATWCSLKAGFMTGSNLYSTIWSGPVFQPLWNREHVVDQCITLRCIANPFVNDSIVSFSVGPYSSQLQFVAQMMADVNLPPVSYAQGTAGQKANDAMTAKQYPRGNGAFGSVAKYLGDIANDNFMFNFYDGKQAYISELSKPDYTPQLIYMPPYPPGAPFSAVPAGVTASIIDTPRQMSYGCEFSVLLDPRLKVQLPPLVIQLQRTVITQQSVTPQAGSQPITPLTTNPKLLVAQVRHRGDTRGNTWQTDVVGFSTTYAENLLSGLVSPNSQGG